MAENTEDEKLQLKMAKTFIKHCIEEFKWTDLSKDVIMDVGCGEEANCGKALIEKFPIILEIIFIDNSPQEISNFKLEIYTKMQLVTADIQIRHTLENYLGKMDKVFSTYVFHVLEHKEEAFRNVYHLLKPGGEAAIVAIKESLLNEFIEELIKIPKWEKAYEIKFPESALRNELGADYYREIVEKVGFHIIECKEQRTEIPYPNDDECKAELYSMSANNFNIPPDAIDEFAEAAFQSLLKVSKRDDEGRPCHRPLEVSILLTKPTEGCASKAK